MASVQKPSSHLPNWTQTHAMHPSLGACVPTWASELISIVFIINHLPSLIKYPNFTCTSLFTGEIKLLLKVFPGHLLLWLVCPWHSFALGTFVGGLSTRTLYNWALCVTVLLKYFSQFDIQEI